MTTGTKEQVILQAISDFDGIKEAIEEGGVAVPYDTDTSEYGELIRKAIAAGGGGMDEEAVRKIVEEYLAENLPSVVSPVVEVAEINGGHRVSITDANGTQSFDVMDGEDADVVLFSEHAVVGNAVGGFNVNDSLQNLTIREIITKLLDVQMIVDVESITISEQGLTVNIGDAATLVATVFPENATDKTLVWASDNDAVATVEGGVVTAIGEGSAVITATTANGLQAKCVVTVLGIIGKIITDEIPMLSGSEDGVSATTYSYLQMTESEAATAPKTSGFYQIVDSNNNVIESGYQIITESTGRTNYAIALLEGTTITNVMMWDEPTRSWVDYSPAFTQTGKTTFDGNTYIIYTSNDSSSGETLRFIVE